MADHLSPSNEKHDVTFDPETYEGSPNVSVVYGFTLTVVSFMLFSLLNYVALTTGPPKQVRGDIWRWRNTLVSMVHSLVTGAMAGYCLLYKREVFEDFVLHCDYFTYTLLAISFGYFCYDMFDHIVNNKAISNPEIVIHHTFNLLTFYYHTRYRVFVSYSTVALLSEIHSAFLHARKLMQFQQWPFDNFWYRIIVWLNIITLVLFRLPAAGILTSGIYYDWHRVTAYYHILIIPSCLMLDILNPILTWRIIKNDILRFYRRKQHMSVEKNGTTNSKLHQH